MSNQNPQTYPLYHILLVDGFKEIQHMIQQLIFVNPEQAWEAAQGGIPLIRDDKKQEELDQFVRLTEQEIELICTEKGYGRVDEYRIQKRIAEIRRRKTRDLWNKILEAADKADLLRKQISITPGREIGY